MLDDAGLERYSRQILVPGFDIEGQARLAAASVLLVGCGGLGSPLAMYLAAAGVGRLVLFDDDRVEASNLPRQIAFTEADVGAAKSMALAARLRAMNSSIEVEAHEQRFTGAMTSTVAAVDLVLDASDSRATRLAIEDSTRAARKPWIMGAAIQMSGQWLAIDPEREHGCYRCLSPDTGDTEAGGCARLGVLGPVVGAVAMAQATLALRYLAGDRPEWGLLTLADFRRGEQQVLRLAACGACVERGERD